jgi:hypothetical protein
VLKCNTHKKFKESAPCGGCESCAKRPCVQLEFNIPGSLVRVPPGIGGPTFLAAFLSRSNERGNIWQFANIKARRPPTSPWLNSTFPLFATALSEESASVSPSPWCISSLFSPPSQTLSQADCEVLFIVSLVRPVLCLPPLPRLQGPSKGDVHVNSHSFVSVCLLQHPFPCLILCTIQVVSLLSNPLHSSLMVGS